MRFISLLICLFVAQECSTALHEMGIDAGSDAGTETLLVDPCSMGRYDGGA